MSKNHCTVSVWGGEGPYQNIKKALSFLDLSPFQGKKVLVKPNVGRQIETRGAVNTHPQAVAAVLDALVEAGVSALAVGESPILGVNTLQAFEMAGIGEVARERQVPLIDMDVRRPVERDVQNGRVLETLKFCADLSDFDAVVSVPVAKTHMHTQVTLGIKNMKGCLWRHEKVRLHQLQYKDGQSYPEKTLDSAISDLASLLLPHLTVVDGYRGMQGLGPGAGEPVESNFALASFHALAADTVASELMGFGPDEVVHLRLIRERGIDSLEGLHVLPSDYLKWQTLYDRPPTKIGLAFPSVVVHQGRACSACLSTTLLFLKRFASELGDYALQDGKLHLAIGKEVPNDAPPGTFYVGNCTYKESEQGTFVKGCPPVASKIYSTITGDEPSETEPENTSH